MSGVHAVVVTRDRVDLLRECLAALAAQTHPVERVTVVDNDSSDGTLAMLEAEHPEADVLALGENQGGAGGFHEGMKRAHAAGAEWLWVMDDDTIPEPGALAALLAASERAPRQPALLASKVVWTDGSIHPMNFPFPERSRVERAIEGAERGLMPLRFATFVSLLVHRRAVDEHGLPLKHFFLWSDDVEFTSRVLLSGELGYLVPESVALHKTQTAHSPMSAPPERFYFHVRNTLWMARRPERGARDRLVRLWILVTSTVEYLLRNRRGLGAVARGLRDGLRPQPR